MRDDVAGPDGSGLSEGLGAWWVSVKDHARQYGITESACMPMGCGITLTPLQDAQQLPEKHMSNLALDLIASQRVKFCPVKMAWMAYKQEQHQRQMAARLIAGDY